MTLRVRWLGRTRYRDSLALQHALARHGADDWLLLQEHEHVVTLGVRADRSHLLVDPTASGADLESVDRGGDVTYHGPGQLVGYPILTLPGHRGGDKPDTRRYVNSLEDVIIDALAALGLPGAGRLEGYPGVWIDPEGPRPRKIAAVGVRLDRRRSMHGFALNVDPDMSRFDQIVPCGIADLPTTSLRTEGASATLAEAVDAVVGAAVARWGRAGWEPQGWEAADRGPGDWERADVVWRRRPEDLAPFSRGLPAGSGRQGATEPVAVAEFRDAAGTGIRLRGRLAEAGVSGGVRITDRKPEWMRAQLRHGPDVLATRAAVRGRSLVTVCEEAGCPNLSECWAEGTATFMINGSRCTRACGFCLVDTAKPLPLDPGEPSSVAAAAREMGLGFVVITAVARDDLDDGGARPFAETIRAVREQCPGARVEVLIPDFAGDPESLATVFDARPDVLNHNVETVPRLQRAARPSASYGRSLAVLGRAVEAGLVAKSGMVLGMGETAEEVGQTLADLAGVGCSIVTLGQYLRPTRAHLPVARWWTPADFDRFAEIGRALGIAHVESSPFTRSSHHAAAAADAAAGPWSADAHQPISPLSAGSSPRGESRVPVV